LRGALARGGGPGRARLAAAWASSACRSRSVVVVVVRVFVLDGRPRSAVHPGLGGESFHILRLIGEYLVLHGRGGRKHWGWGGIITTRYRLVSQPNFSTFRGGRAMTADVGRNSTARFSGHCRGAAGGRLYQQMERVIVGPAQPCWNRLLIGPLLTGGPYSAGGRARPGQDAGGAQRLAQGPAPDLPPHPVSRPGPVCPADVIGTQIYNPAHRRVHHQEGPDLPRTASLADEVNRAPPPRCRAPCSKRCREKQVTIGDVSYRLEEAVPGAGDAEPHRAGGHLPTARGRRSIASCSRSN